MYTHHRKNMFITKNKEIFMHYLRKWFCNNKKGQEHRTTLYPGHFNFLLNHSRSLLAFLKPLFISFSILKLYWNNLDLVS